MIPRMDFSIVRLQLWDSHLAVDPGVFEALFFETFLSS